MPESNSIESKSGRVAVGHPVDVASGAVFTVQHDFTYPGTVTLDWQRRYSTDSIYNGILGRGWTVPYLMRLEEVPGAIQFFDEEGGTLNFPIPYSSFEVGETITSLGANMALRREADHYVVIHWHYGTDHVERFYFDPNGGRAMPLVAVENLQGHRISVTYDPHGRPSRITQEAEARVFELTYGEDDLLESVSFLKESGQRKRLASYRYDAARNLVAFTNALGATTTYEYDDRHRMAAETNCLGSTFRFEYDQQGRCVYSGGDGGYMARRLQYFNAPRMTRVTDSLGNKIDYVFNYAGLVIQEITSIGGPWTSEYDEFGREVVQSDPIGGSVRYGYDEWGNRSSILDENGAETRLSYNELHVLEAYTDPMGSTWTFEHTDDGNVVGAVDPLGGHQTIIRDERNLVTRTTTAAGREIARRYGPALRWFEAVDQISLISRLEFNDEGGQTAVYDANGLVQQVRFDACNRPVEAVDGAGNVYQMQWNLLGQLIERTGPDIGWERREYDPFGQLTKHVNPLGEMCFAYDTEGRMTDAVNRAGERMRFTYDAEGRLVAQQHFDGRIERCEFDARGKPTLIRLNDSRELAITYDPVGHVIGRKGSDGLVETFTLNKNGEVVRAETADTVVELVRDQVGVVIAEIQNGERIEYAHDADGYRTARRIPGIPGADLERKNDVRGRLTGLVDAGGLCQELRWDNVDRIVQRTFSGGVEELDYDFSGRLERQRVHAHDATVVERRYEYDRMGNIQRLDESRKGRSEFEYDAIGRLLTAKVAGHEAERYRYDANGSITETHRGRRVLEAGGRTLDTGQRSYLYDVNGCVSKIRGIDAELDLAYDVDGRLVAVSSPDGMSARYTYDALGRRTRKVVDGVRTDYLWEGFVLAGQGREGHFDQTFFFHALDPLAQWHDGKRNTPVTDQAGMVREVIDARGGIVQEASAEVYGLLVRQIGSEPTPFRLRGQYFDAETGLHFNFHRTYDPYSGNYLSPDPIGVEGGANSYAYPRNPLLWDDPFGLSCGRASCKAEAKMTAAMKARGYDLVSKKGKSVMGNGIDGIYHNPKAVPPEPKYIIAEAKSGGAVLRWSGPKDANGKGTIQQMSDGWINGAPGGDPNKSRLEAALPPNADGSKNQHLAAIENAPAGTVGKEVFNPDKNPTTRNLPNYGGPGSPTPTI